MKKTVFALAAALAGSALAGHLNSQLRTATRSVASPDGRTVLSVAVGENLSWGIVRNGAELLAPDSRLGLKFDGKDEMKGFTIVSERTAKVDDVFTTRFYRREKIDLRANELTLGLKANDGQELGLVLRAYDGSVAFRYVIPGGDAYAIERELTRWSFFGSPEAWISYDRAGEDDNLFADCGGEEGTFARTTLGMMPRNGLIAVPAVVRAGETRMALCEAELTGWASLWFQTDAPPTRRRQTVALDACLTKTGKRTHAVRGQARRVSPWRVAILAESDVGLLENNDVIYALNPPPEGGEAAFDWVKPGATGWDWWADMLNVSAKSTTESTIRQIDFAAEMGWPYHTVDAGWYGAKALDTNLKLDPRADYDLMKVLAHAKEKNVGLWLWVYCGTLSSRTNGIEETFAKFERWGVKGVKIDFLSIGDQGIVDWCDGVTRCAAKHHLMVNFHSAYHPSGTERTWPNLITREGILGNEMNKVFGWVTPEYMATLPYTRFLIGPGDYTPGSFGNVRSRDFVAQVARAAAAGAQAGRIFPQEVGTRGHALALCVAYDSPLMTLCDWPENYRGQPGAEALRNLPTVWKKTIPLKDGRIGENYSVLREAPDGRWYFAAFTVRPRTARLPFSLLGDGEYEATAYADDPARTPQDATALRVFTQRLTSRDTLEIPLSDEGGCLVLIRPCK